MPLVRPRSRPQLVSLVTALGLSFLALGCGKKDEPKVEEITTYEKVEAKTLKSGEALTKDAEKKAEEAAKKAEAAKINDLATKAVAALKSKTDSIDIIDVLDKIAAKGPALAATAPEIEKFLDHEDGDVKAAALAAFAAVVPARAEDLAARALKSDDETLRKAGVVAWTNLKNGKIQPLIDLLTDVDEGVQAEAVKGIIAGTVDEHVANALAAKLTDMLPAAARLAMPVVKEKRGVVKDLEPKVVEWLGHRDPLVRSGAISFVEDLDLRKYAIAKRLVLNLADDDDTKVRGDSYRLLKRWAGVGAPDYEPDGSEDDRKAARDDWKTWLEENKDKFPSS